jgi:simple sugar transport system ATP-binding protein
MSVSDVCTVLRKGKCINTVKTSETNTDELAKMMVGRDVSFTVDKTQANPSDTILRVENVSVIDKDTKKNVVNNVSFSVKAGEIVAIAGIDGNGQTPLINAITGLGPVSTGTIHFLDDDVTNGTIKERIMNGMSHIPEDRHKHGLILDYNLAENFVIERYLEDRFTRHKKRLIHFENRKNYSDYLIDNYDVRSGQGSYTNVRSMSGGNQQKAIVARELDKDHSILIACQPTRGLDVGAIEDIHKKIIKDRDNGAAVLLFSLELDEVLNLADRIYVIYDGELVAHFINDGIKPEDLGLYMTGSKRMEEIAC